MKPYFVKYFAVDGEVSTGDFFIERGHVYGPMDAATAANIRKGFVPARKAVRYLCYRDTQNVKSINIDQQQWQEMSRSEKDEHLLSIGQYKVIGEISPEATWVKEGDEFDDKDIEVYTIDVLENRYIPISIEEKRVIERSKSIIKIKGSCGHFH